MARFSNQIDQSFFIETYGCTFNQGDSEKIETVLIQNDFKKVDFDSAQIIIVNTCAVKHTTETKLIARIKFLCRMHPDKIILITGCLPQIDNQIKSSLEVILENHGFIVHPLRILSIVEYISKYLNHETIEEEQIAYERDKSCVIQNTEPNQIIGIVQISEGCNYNCSYCCTKTARGELMSFDFDKIIRQIHHFVENGIKEICLTGQDLGIYNFNNKKLNDLLEEISRMPGEFTVRLGMLNPNYLLTNLERFLQIFENTRFFRFLHVPIQSANDRILKLMHRPYKIQKVKDVIERIRQLYSQFSFSTDIITGFPTETDQEHKETIQFIEWWKPDILNISKYSNRPNTEAKTLPQLKSQIIKKRSLEFTQLFESYNQEKNKNWINWSGTVLINEFDNSKEFPFMGRNLYYKPIMLKEGQIGELCEVKIIDSLHYSLIGQRV